MLHGVGCPPGARSLPPAHPAGAVADHDQRRGVAGTDRIIHGHEMSGQPIATVQPREWPTPLVLLRNQAPRDVPHTMELRIMTVMPSSHVRDGDHCDVIGGTHKGKAGTVRDIKTGKTGHVSITVVQSNGVRFKTLAKNVSVDKARTPDRRRAKP